MKTLINQQKNKYRPILYFGIVFAIIFALWVYLVASNSNFISAFDKNVYNFIRNRNSTEWKFAVLWTNMGNTVTIVCITVVLVIALAIFKRYAYAIFSAVTMALANGCNWIIKHLVQRQRPRYSASLHAEGFSFPSGHSVGSMSLAIVLIFLICLMVKKKGLKIFLSILSALFTLSIGFTRMYLHVHWPSDVCGGWLEGLTFGLICGFILLKITESKKQENNYQSHIIENFYS